MGPGQDGPGGVPPPPFLLGGGGSLMPPAHYGPGPLGPLASLGPGGRGGGGVSPAHAHAAQHGGMGPHGGLAAPPPPDLAGGLAGIPPVSWNAALELPGPQSTAFSVALQWEPRRVSKQR
jgi:hypothetical protein